MEFTTLLMDADDTIFDFARCEYYALKESVEALGLTFDEEVHQSFSAINTALWKQLELGKIAVEELRVQRFRQMLQKCFDKYDQAEELAERYVESLSRQSILIGGAEEAVAQLSEVYSLYLITNGLKQVQRGRLARTGVSRYFRNVFISDEVGFHKPEREFFDYVLQRVEEKDPSRIMVVGDSLSSDMQGGRNAGLTTCLYDPKEKTPFPHPLCDRHIRSLTELLPEGR